MRITALAGLAIATLFAGGTALTASEEGWSLRGGANYKAGVGAVDGMTGPQALYIRGADNAGVHRYYFGTLEREIPAKALRGERVRLSVRLRNEDIASTLVTLQVNRGDGTAIRSPATTRWQTEEGGAWRVKQFVLDVPADAQNMLLDVSVKDKGKVWVDELRLEAVDRNVQVSSSGLKVLRRGDETFGLGGIGSQPNSANLAPDPSAYAPLINGSFTAGGTPVTPVGATPR